MTKKFAPILILIACFIAVAFATMIYGFTRSNPFSQHNPEKIEKSQTTYNLPRVVPAVWVGSH